MAENRKPNRGSLGLAALARGMAALAPQGTQINFQVHHVLDRPGYLLGLLGYKIAQDADQPDDQQPQDSDQPQASEEVSPGHSLGQMLCANCNGTTVIIGTDVGPLDAALLEGYQGRTALTKIKAKDVPHGKIFAGAARPNPTFLYEEARRFEVLVEIDADARVQGNLLEAHAQAILGVMHKIATLATGGPETPGMPLFSVQSPVQTWFQEPSAADDSAPWPPPAAAAVRAVYTMSQSTAKLRMTIAKELANYCVDRGFGLWLGDLRIGSSQGRWFRVVSPEREKLQRTLAGYKQVVGDGKVQNVVPLTLVGPARIGSTHAILSLLSRASGMGIAGCALTALNDLAFIHLQLVTHTLGARTGILDEPDSTSQDADSLSQTLLNMLATLGIEVHEPREPDGHQDQENPYSRVDKRAGDYQLLAGPPFDLWGREAPSPGTPGPYTIWFSWTQYDQSLAGQALAALQRALVQLGLSSNDDAPDNANFEYLVCRDIGRGQWRAKGKLTIRKEVSTTDTYHEFKQTKLCVRLEDAWRSQLVQAESGGIRDISVAWREQYL